MTVTGLHTSKLLISRPLSGAGAPRAEPVKAKNKEREMNGRMADLQTF